VKRSASADTASVLVVGGAKLGKGTHLLMADHRLDLVETGVYIGPRVSVACDGHQLPFADGVFDGVVIQAVLEHVVDPSQVVAEIHRVLRPGGIVFAETPFMQQVHEGAYDFTRFTELGHRLLFRMFTEIDRGVAVGPATALLWSLRYLAASLPPRSRIAARLLEKATTAALFWLKYLDRLLVTHRGAHDAASGVYFLGARADTPVSLREALSTYRGTMGSVAEERGLA
jgi:SAM-dependent methyltransferase